jgi:hypothetical protein
MHAPGEKEQKKGKVHIRKFAFFLDFGVQGGDSGRKWLVYCRAV